MTARPQRAYRFRTTAQWAACLFDRVTQDAAGLRPAAPFEPKPERHATRGAHAPAVTRSGEVLWLDDAGFLYRLARGEEAPVQGPAPLAMARSPRLVATSNGLWVIGDAPGSVQRYDEETLSRLSSLNIDGARVVDIAAGANDALIALVERDGRWHAHRIDCTGRIRDTVSFDGLSHARAFVVLRRAQRFVVWDGGAAPALHWFSHEGGPAQLTVPIRCASASALGSDAQRRIFLAVTVSDARAAAGPCQVLVFDEDGASVGEVPLAAQEGAVTGVTATRDSLLVTVTGGLLRHSVARAVPDAAPQVRCALITPMLHSPDPEDRRRWLRVEATVRLPDGATLEIAYAATSDPALRDRLALLTADGSLPSSHRVQRLLREPGLWRTAIAFHGGGASPSEPDVTLAAPLFDVREPYLWVCVTLSAAAGAALPILEELVVLYPGRTLMEQLPAIYRRAETQPGGFLRSLVGVLECTTQGLDARIAALGRHVHPSTATRPWLDFVSRWLGLPWDDALDDGRKRRIVERAANLARGRGTRAGLEALLECLIPGPVRRFRVTDPTADHGFAIVGGGDCRGSALPALVAGRTPWQTELDASTVLGHMRLPCAGQVPDGARSIAGRIRVDIAASGDERRAWEPWLGALIAEMVPFNVRLQLRWVDGRTLRGSRLDESTVLEAASTPHLDSDSVIGVASLPARGSRITRTGADTGTRLQ